MLEDAKCPFCILPLDPRGADEAACANGHVFDATGLSLATNMGAARALWLAVSAMQDDAAGLAWRAKQPEVAEGTSASLLEQAQEAREAAVALRVLASAAQRRLDGLPYPTTVVRIEEPAADP